MSEKIKLTRDQAEAIESGLKVTDNRKRDILKAHMQVQGSLVGALEPLNELAFDNLVEALYIGYEVEPEFKAGDYTTNTRTGVTIKLDEDKAEFVNNHYLNKDELRHATPEEIAQEKERRWWSKHGRETKEYREGDILQGMDEIFEVKRIDHGDAHSIRFINERGRDDGYNKNANLTVVCFAESRLDGDSHVSR